MSNTENPNVESPELELEDEGDTDLKVRTNLKAGLGELIAPQLQPILNPLDLVGMKLSGASRITGQGQTY